MKDGIGKQLRNYSMKYALQLLAGGFSYIGRGTSPRFEPLSITPFADAKKSLIKQAAPMVISLKQKLEQHGKSESRATQ